jgi:endonuclease YncB( thermonuclease family)
MKIMTWMLITLLSFAAQAADLSGTVVRIVDGDTLVLLDSERTQHKVRLTEIDAPESNQPFGKRSKQALSDLCAGKPAVIKSSSKDRYDRTLGRVFCDGKDANADLVAQGMAWVYTRYNKDKSLIPLQQAAQQAKRGLWSDPQPVPPWEWRKRK